MDIKKGLREIGIPKETFKIVNAKIFKRLKLHLRRTQKICFVETNCIFVFPLGVRTNRCADYPGLAFGSAMFGSDTMMKFNIIKNELHNIMRSQLKRVDGEVSAMAQRIKALDANLELSEQYIKTATATLAEAVQVITLVNMKVTKSRIFKSYFLFVTFLFKGKLTNCTIHFEF
jgi:hypothetical protein